jgi:hypothetical protein
VVPGIFTDEIATLSLATTVNERVTDWTLVVRLTLALLTEKLEIVGFSSSTLLIVISNVSLTELLFVSVTVKVNVSVEFPNE